MRLGQYQIRAAEYSADIEAALTLRSNMFRSGGADRDAFDDHATQYIVTRVSDDATVCTFRTLLFANGAALDQSYTAAAYDLSALAKYSGTMLELGRFCTAQDINDPDILRLAWAMLTRVVDEEAVKFLFGSSSFMGNDPTPYLDSFAMLRDGYLAPADMRPGVKAPHVFSFDTMPVQKVDRKKALKSMPPLLKTYMGMGGWVSDHAVIDDDLGTLHVFTGVEIDAVPPARAKALRLLASMD